MSPASRKLDPHRFFSCMTPNDFCEKYFVWAIVLFSEAESEREEWEMGEGGDTLSFSIACLRPGEDTKERRMGSRASLGTGLSMSDGREVPSLGIDYVRVPFPSEHT